MLGEIFKKHGAEISQLNSAPDANKLKSASVYIIVDPDTEKEAEDPNYITAVHASNIASWVKNGGVLILLGNDAGNTDLENFNLISLKYGISFNDDNFNLVKDNQFEQGAVPVAEGHSVLPSSSKLYVKELATLEVKTPGTVVLKKDGKNIIATANYGKGHVFVIGDPWLYNEYIDGRKLPAGFDNFAAANDLVKWALYHKNR
jgi:unsaturated rhamnogalacturonyl hydrolase